MTVTVLIVLLCGSCFLASAPVPKQDCMSLLGSHCLLTDQQRWNLPAATTSPAIDTSSYLQVAFAGWCLAGGVSAVTGPLRGIRRAAICSAVYMAPWVGGGADVPLVNILKHIFQRIRPSAIAHKSFAFPSGCGGQNRPHHRAPTAYCLNHLLCLDTLRRHCLRRAVALLACCGSSSASSQPDEARGHLSRRQALIWCLHAEAANMTVFVLHRHTTCAVFLFGALFFILLPGALSLTDEGDALDVQQGSKASAPAISIPGAELMRSALRLSTPVLPFLWIAGGLSTATGRVLGEAHWVSDTMAGACLGAALVCVAAMVDKNAARVIRRLSAKP